jgi:hypothetical protein
MSSLIDRPELIGFFSYSREDDEDADGALSRLRDRIQRELGSQLGRSRKELRLWQDKAAIPHGAFWEKEISHAIAESTFFIPIVTPRAVRSRYCVFEFKAFLAREAELGRDDLVFPILYIPVLELEREDVWRADPLLTIIGTRHYLDWRDLRHQDTGSTEARIQIQLFCTNVSNALRKHWMTPQEQQRADEEEERRRTEEESRRKALEADARARAEAAAKAKAEADAKAKADADAAAKAAKAKADVEAAAKAEADAKAKADAEAARATAESKARADADAGRRAEALLQSQRAAEAARVRAGQAQPPAPQRPPPSPAPGNPAGEPQALWVIVAIAMIAVGLFFTGGGALFDMFRTKTAEELAVSHTWEFFWRYGIWSASFMIGCITLWIQLQRRK